MVPRVFSQAFAEDVTSKTNSEYKGLVMQLKNLIRNSRIQKRQLLFEKNVKLEKASNKRLYLEMAKGLVAMSEKSDRPQTQQWGAKLKVVANSFK